MGVTKKILVTGANKGIGLAVCEALLESYSETFVFLGCRDRDMGNRAIEAIIQRNPRAENHIALVEIDVTNDSSVQMAADEINKHDASGEPNLYGIVNNAGIARSDKGPQDIIEVNTKGTKRVIDCLCSILQPKNGRVVNVTSASGPNFLSRCDRFICKILTNENVSWDEISKLCSDFIEKYDNATNSVKAQLVDEVYGFSKACTNALTMCQARLYPNLIINACTPGFIETDMTRPMALRNGRTPAEMGMKQTRDGVYSILFLLMEHRVGSGFYFGSDCLRSPLDCYRAPGEPEYTGP